MKRFASASSVKEGDVLAYANPRQSIIVERISVNGIGKIGFHGNDDTWSAFYWPGERVRVEIPNEYDLPRILQATLQKFREWGSIHPSHLDPLAKALETYHDSDENIADVQELAVITKAFLEKVQREGWAIHESHLIPLAESVNLAYPDEVPTESLRERV